VREERHREPPLTGSKEFRRVMARREK
jgi:hypothetical protein